MFCNPLKLFENGFLSKPIFGINSAWNSLLVCSKGIVVNVEYSTERLLRLGREGYDLSQQEAISER
jgi:hypothetical protein